MVSTVILRNIDNNHKFYLIIKMYSAANPHIRVISEGSSLKTGVMMLKIHDHIIIYIQIVI